MVNIKELVDAEVLSLESFSRSKVAKAVALKLKAMDVEAGRGEMAMIYNAIDARSRELLRDVKVTHVINVKTRKRVVNDGDAFLRENVTVTQATDREFSLVESVREIGAQMEEKHKLFLKEPTESRMKAFYRLNRVLSSALFQLAQSEAPEDKTLAENWTKRVAQLKDAVRSVGVQ